MNKSELMIGDIVNSPKDLKRMKVVEIKENTVTLKSLLGDETSERAYSELEPLIFFDNRIFIALGFSDREIKTSVTELPVVDKIVQLFSPTRSDVFYTLTIVSVSNGIWKVEIKDNSYSICGSGNFGNVHQLQNIVRSITGLEFNATGL